MPLRDLLNRLVKKNKNVRTRHASCAVNTWTGINTLHIVRPSQPINDQHIEDGNIFVVPAIYHLYTGVTFRYFVYLFYQGKRPPGVVPSFE